MIIAGLSVGVAMLLMAGVLSLIYYHYRPPCSEQEYSETTSPDGQWAAAVLERRCGEESPFVFHVNLRRAGEPVRLGYLSGKADEGEVFRVQEDSADSEPKLEWNSPRQLTIVCPHCRTAQKREDHWGPITVRYQLQP